MDRMQFDAIEKKAQYIAELAACGRSLPATAFYAHKTHTDGLQSRCKECQKARRRVLEDERRQACKATA